MHRRNLLGHVVIAIASLAVAFFGVFNVLFSDANGVNERIGAVTIILLVYTMVSLLAHWIWPVKGWTWVRWLIIPALVFSGFYFLKEFSSLSWYGAGVLVATVAGATLGREVIGRYRAAPPIVPTV